MNLLTFDHIYTPGQLVFENKLYQHYHDPTMSLLYEYNFISFKRMPVMKELLEAETYLDQYHYKHNQYHLRFTFPSDEKLPTSLIIYLKDRGYTVGDNELYAIDPINFRGKSPQPSIKIEPVTLGNLEKYLFLQHWQDFAYGNLFAKQKQLDYRQRFESEHFIQILAFDEVDPVGSVDVILGEDTVEIDNLFVEKTHQNQGVGSALQRYVMDKFTNRTIILIADGSDTVKEMYKKQNYQSLGFKYEALKI